MTAIKHNFLLWLMGALVSFGIPALAQTSTEIVLHNFGRTEGVSPTGGVVRDSAGNLYGTAGYGGPSELGAIFRVDPAGHYKLIFSFEGVAGGALPTGIVRDPEGNFYGVAERGGAIDGGVIFKIDPAGNETVLYNLTLYNAGAACILLRDPTGNLYGTTTFGGTYSCPSQSCGTLFELDAAGNFSVLYNFNGSAGSYPTIGLVRDPAGDLFGTTSSGGAYGQGTVYKFDTTGNLTVLYSFKNKDDGGSPNGNIVLDGLGNLYGSTAGGGAANNGVIFRLDALGRFSVLYTFNDGGTSDSGLSLDAAGSLYGIRPSTSSAKAGVVYKLDAAGNYSVLYSFLGTPDGSEPESAPIPDPSGNVYGTTISGGGANAGTVYKLDPSGHETILHSFANGAFGAEPGSGLTADAEGNLYSATSRGGLAGFGVIYKLDRAGRYTVLHSFSGPDGALPVGNVILDPGGNLYGTTYSGGSATSSCTDSRPLGCGVVYELDTAGVFTVLHSFTNGADSGPPLAGVVRDDAGNLYGTASGGPSGHGVVFKLDTTGKFTVLYTFTNAAGGLSPNAVTLDQEGNLYGTASSGGAGDYGVVFELDTTGNYKVLYRFTGGADGGLPEFGVIRDPAGNLYGTTRYGDVFKLDSTGHETVLYTFTGGADGGEPEAGVIRDSAGNLYGTTYAGGGSGSGVVFKIDPSGHESVLYNFAGAAGAYPASGVIFDAAGNLYGTASGGGANDGGVIFKLIPN